MLRKAAFYCPLAFSLSALLSGCQTATVSAQASEEDQASSKGTERFIPPVVARIPPPPITGQTIILPSGPYFDVTIFGATCNGKTDDTTAFTNAASAALASGGVVYVPHSPNNSRCVTNLSAFNNFNGQVWLYVVDDNDLTVSGAMSGVNVAVIGRASQYSGMSGQFQIEPHIDWVAANNTTSALEMNGFQGGYFEGIAFAQPRASSLPVVNLHTNTASGAGIVYVTFKGDYFMSPQTCASEPAFRVGPDASRPTGTAGFGMFVTGSYFSCVGASTGAAIQIVNYGGFHISGPEVSTFSSGGISITNNQGNDQSQFQFENILAENLGQPSQVSDFVAANAIEGPIDNISIEKTSLADPVGPVYMFGAYSAANGNIRGIKIEDIDYSANGLFDPASTANIFGMTCWVGPGCSSIRVNHAGTSGIQALLSYERESGHINTPFYVGTNYPGPALDVDGGAGGVSALFRQGISVGGLPVTSLPSASSNPGLIIRVTDSTPISLEGQACVGGSGNNAIAISNGVSWKCF